MIYELKDVAEAGKQRLHEAGIPFMVQNLASASASGIRVSSKFIRKAFKVLQVYPVNWEVVNRTTFLVQMKPMREQDSRDVKIAIWNGGGNSAIIGVVRDYLTTVLQQPIFLYDLGGERALTVADDTFAVWFNSSDAGGRTVSAPTQLLGIPVSCTSGVVPRSCTFPYVDPVTGWAIADLIEGGLVIHHHACCNSNANSIELLRRILEWTCEQLAKQSSVYQERWLQVQQELERTQLAALSQQILNYATTERSRMRNEVKDLISEVATLQSKLHAASERSQVATRRLAGAEALVEGLITSVSNAFTAILRNPKVASVRKFGSRGFEVTTRTLYCTHPETGQKYLLGQFNIQVEAMGATLLLRCLHVDGSRVTSQGRQHAPHVDVNGKPLLGSFNRLVVDLIARYAFAELIDLVLQYLETLDLSDPTAETIQAWVGASEEQVEVPA